MYTFQDYIAEVNETSYRFPSWHYGQTLFNVLAQDPVNSWIAEDVRGNYNDPFHVGEYTPRDVRRDRLASFLAHVEDNWSDYNPAMYDTRTVMVLNDWETYTDLAGCAIVVVPPEIADNEVDEFVKDALQSDSPSVIERF